MGKETFNVARKIVNAGWVEPWLIKSSTYNNIGTETPSEIELKDAQDDANLLQKNWLGGGVNTLCLEMDVVTYSAGAI